MTNNFNLVAPLYDRLGDLVYGGDLQAAQNEYLSQLPNEGEVLFIGGGSGLALRRLIKLKPELKICYLDASSRMIEISKKVIPQKEHNRVEFKVGTENTIPPQKKYDAMITFFFLDLFREDRKQKIFNKLNGHLKPGGLWLQADLLPAKGLVSTIREKLMFLFFKIFSKIEASSIHEDQILFKNADFREINKKHFHKNQIYSGVYQKP